MWTTTNLLVADGVGPSVVRSRMMECGHDDHPPTSHTQHTLRYPAKDSNANLNSRLADTPGCRMNRAGHRAALLLGLGPHIPCIRGVSLSVTLSRSPMSELPQGACCPQQPANTVMSKEREHYRHTKGRCVAHRTNKQNKYGIVHVQHACFATREQLLRSMNIPNMKLLGHRMVSRMWDEFIK